MVILENIDIDIDKAILQNIDIDKISNRFKFGISNRATRDPPPFMANAILNFHFDYLHTSLIDDHVFQGAFF